MGIKYISVRNPRKAEIIRVDLHGRPGVHVLQNGGRYFVEVYKI